MIVGRMRHCPGEVKPGASLILTVDDNRKLDPNKLQSKLTHLSVDAACGIRSDRMRP